ncbi:winged helix-turn-helix domain-containing protein [Amphritea balenae]|uniref:Transcriptional regulator n=1 Tax=Amphritea balenae TaxID=452629 RepID=A0A3P1SQA1_9GAMM|nr:winged helix-turn-helix domain-containing protein [Amphritea balenae]RRC99303.1 transcriptional regulator [Amphritea balenae]GGK72192.1 hypothetical protein GCM10007941_22790 [Amphritea balenae]
MTGHIADLLARKNHANFANRSVELATLCGTLQDDLPRVIHISGIPGIGKSTLLEMYTDQAREQGAIVIRLDCRTIEPTPKGLLKQLDEATGLCASNPEQICDRFADFDTRVVLAFDNYEVFRLMDTWLRQTFIPALPNNARVLLFSRERPGTGWYTTAGWHDLFKTLDLGPLSDDDAENLLNRLGVTPSGMNKIIQQTRGHPLALQLAASACRGRQQLVLTDPSLQYVLETLTRMFLEDVSEPLTRLALEATSVSRRITLPMLRALFPNQVPQDIFERLATLPFAELRSDGLVLHDVVRESLAHSLKARDPETYLNYRRIIWRQLSTALDSAGSHELWRYTADMLFLIENPVVREAFFPSGSNQLTVEPATPSDSTALQTIITRHEGPQAAQQLLRWWQRLPQSFSVVRDGNGSVAAIYCKISTDSAEPAWLEEDPVTREWLHHLRQHPLQQQQTVLFCRRWLSQVEGESPSACQAAIWLDLKRSYMEMRPDLRRVYLTLCDLPAYAPVALKLGFEVLTGQEVTLDSQIYHSAVLDFGPASVDGWLADIAAAELGIQQDRSLLDIESHELIIDDKRESLTPLEFGVIQHLLAKQGKAVSRSELLRDVWGTRYEGGSNVVDAVVRGLRRKLAHQASCIETVTGVGYLYREQP